jgi:hypothetical protein
MDLQPVVIQIKFTCVCAVRERETERWGVSCFEYRARYSGSG